MSDEESIYGAIYDQAIVAVAEITKAHIDCCDFKNATGSMKIQEDLLNLRNSVLDCPGDDL